MRRINKGEQLVWFEAWKEQFRLQHGRNPRYKEDFFGTEKYRLKEQLLQEQGYICCYCMKRISDADSHIEHFWPRHYFGRKDMEYHNMLVSCQGDGGEEHCGHKKEDWYLADLVSPTDPAIDSMFLYLEDGEILPGGKDHEAWLENQMIDHLALNSFYLTRSRRGAIEASEVYDEEDYSDIDIRAFVDYYDHMEDGKYMPYCQCIIDCLARQLSG